LENLVEVRRVARRICARLPKHVPFDDLVHSGVLGLINAVEKFNPSKNVSLQAYAQIRIRGAILDSLREMDWVRVLYVGKLGASSKRAAR
jgi:RNA polymerase sigma factor for flagellar operon FliA